MKLISFIIPCYNSSAYMRHCIESILPSGEDAEILIVNDGSTKDNTLEIAKEYEKTYPTICRAIDKENGGHGSTINIGLKEAKGLYIRVVDSDDWLSTDSLKKLISKIKEMNEKNQNPDLYVTNFLYDKVGKTHKITMNYKKALPKDKILTWDNIDKFGLGHYLLMHSLTYKTDILRKSKLVLPEHTFYCDNLYAYVPLEYVETVYYLDETLYHYYIGREDQSVNEKIMISRLSQQYRVTYQMLNDVNVMDIANKNKRNYLLNYMSIIMTVTSILSIRSHEDKWLIEKDKLWNYVKEKDLRLYKKLRYSILGRAMNLNGALGRKIAEIGYGISNKIYGFN